MLNIKMIKEQLKLIQTEKISILNTDKSFTRLLELKNLELMLTAELVKILEIQLGKKNNLRKVG
jgi:hypothetical protein